MRTFANLFLILFFADGSVSLLDEAVSLIFSVHAFSGEELKGVRRNLKGT